MLSLRLRVSFILFWEVRFELLPLMTEDRVALEELLLIEFLFVLATCFASGLPAV